MGAGLLAMISILSFYSCSDTWDDHYESTSGLTYDGTIMGYLESQGDLSDFVDILKATGYDQELKSSQVLTVLAPKNGSFDKAALLSQIAAGGKRTVIDEFVKNHICRYNVSIGAKEQVVTMLNEKNIEIGTLSTATVGDTKADKMNVSCNNGVVHVLADYLPYQYNIYEYLAKDYNENADKYVTISADDEDEEPQAFETWYGYLKELYVDSLDEARSVSRGVDENGDQIWVDSVVISNNKILRRMNAYLYREDSTYLTILPSYEAYNNRYQGIRELFNWNISYNSDPVVRDSMSRYFAHYFAMCDLSYNMSDAMNGRTQQDSLYSTVFYRGNWPYHVYYDPFAPGGLMANKVSQIDCSNGTVYTMNEYPFDVFSNIFTKITLEAEHRNYVYEDGEHAFTNTSTTNYTTVSNTADSISGSGYLHVIPSTSNRNTEITFQIPNTLSGQYDFYVKFLPLQVFDTTKTQLPVQFRASIYERSAANGAYPAETRPTYEFQNGTSKNFQTIPDAIDSIYVGTFRFNYCYYSTSAGVLFKLESYVLGSQSSKFTKEMLIDKIVLVPNQTVHNSDGAYVGEAEAARRRK